MWLTTMSFISLLFAVLALVPSGAHLLELPNKINLPRDYYLTVQQNYRGWALLAVVVIGGILSTLILTLMVRSQPRVFGLTLAGLLCLVGTQVVFWSFTFPANQATQNWTLLPDNWAQLRTRWEYSHATSAILNLAALILLLLSVLISNETVR